MDIKSFQAPGLQHSISLAEESDACDHSQVSESGGDFHSFHVSVWEHFCVSVTVLLNSSIYRCLLEAHNSDLDEG